jgi:hypothetical protein
MIIIYRISSNSNKKTRLVNARKEACFENFCDHMLTVDDFLILIADNVDSALSEYLTNNLPANCKMFSIQSGSNGASFRLQIELACNLASDETVFFHEDDYLYRDIKWTNGQKFCNLLIKEGLARANYVSLYDHPDKYRPPSNGGNPFITEHGVENTGVFLTSLSHWKYTNSTTCTFATKVSTVQEDRDVWLKWANGPSDFQAFLELRSRGRTVATSIPGYSTHTEIGFLSPLFDWNEV